VSAADRVRGLGARVAATAAVGLGLALALGGCGGSGPSSSTSSGGVTGVTTTTTTSTTRVTSTHARAHHRPRRVVHGPRVGARQGVHIDGTYLTVTILRVLTLTHTGSAALPGTRQVGVELRIANQAGTTYDSTASGDVSLVLSHGTSEPLDIRRGPCQTQLVDFESIVSAGSVRSGCVAFSVPRSSRVIGVRFSPHSRPPGTLTWRTG
jgi:hypothetical protein